MNEAEYLKTTIISLYVLFIRPVYSCSRLFTEAFGTMFLYKTFLLLRLLQSSWSEARIGLELDEKASLLFIKTRRDKREGRNLTREPEKTRGEEQIEVENEDIIIMEESSK